MAPKAGALGREFGQWVAFKGSVLGLIEKKGAKEMKIKSNTKAGSVIWGS
jgi:hypothetical protein